jgi:two-component system, response regulator YesN
MVIHNIKNKITFSKTLTKMLISYFIIVLISISLISIILYYNFSKATIEDVQTNIQENLIQNMNQLEIIRTNIFALGIQLVNDSDIAYAMYQDELDELTKYRATTKFIQVKNSNPMIHSIYIYNSKIKKYVSNFGVSERPSFETKMEELIKKYKESNQLKFIPLIYSFRAPDGDAIKENIISSVFTDSWKISIDKSNNTSVLGDSAVIINLKAEYLQKSFADLSSNSEIFILNKSGDVISDSNIGDFAGNMLNTTYINTILNSKTFSGYFIRKEDNSKFLITYAYSDKIPFIFINKSNYETIIKKVYNLRSNIIIVFIVILVVCLILSIMAAYNVYLPFDRLVKTVKLQLATGAGNKSEKSTYNELTYLSETFSNIIKRSNEM